VEVRALEVKHGLKLLLPYGVLLIPRSAIGSVVVAVRRSSDRGESDVHHHFNAGVRLAADDEPRLWFRGVER
jgi:hypothetical protein